jgi:hypothetical protein
MADLPSLGRIEDILHRPSEGGHGSDCGERFLTRVNTGSGRDSGFSEVFTTRVNTGGGGGFREGPALPVFCAPSIRFDIHD